MAHLDYKKETTYLLKINGEFCRWNGDNSLAYFGSEEDALVGLTPPYNAEAVRVIDCPEDIQKEYELQIDKDYGPNNN